MWKCASNNLSYLYKMNYMKKKIINKKNIRDVTTFPFNNPVTFCCILTQQSSTWWNLCQGEIWYITNKSSAFHHTYGLPN